MMTVIVDKEQSEANEIALLTRKERDWLLGKIEVSKDCQNHLRHRIRRKLEIFWSKELPLLIKQAMIVNVNNNKHSMTTGCHDMTTSSHDSSLTLQRSSLVKIPPQTWQKMKEIESNQTSKETKNKKLNAKWAGSDSNQRPPPCQGSLMLAEYSNYTYEAKDTEGLGGPSSGSLTAASSLVPKYEEGLEDFWTGFETFLTKTNNHRGTKDRLNYARRYGHILKTKDAHELLELTNEKRIHAMKSLSSLAKYTGCYDSWQSIRQNFQLKWSSGDSLYAFASIFDSKKDFEHMLLWLTQTCSRIPERYANILIFNTLTGLRPSEACMSLRLIHNNAEGYLSSDSHTLEHFRFPDIFIRRTKKAYVSIINDQVSAASL
jgi:hypothetical protein